MDGTAAGLAGEALTIGAAVGAAVATGEAEGRSVATGEALGGAVEAAVCCGATRVACGVTAAEGSGWIATGAEAVFAVVARPCERMASQAPNPNPARTTSAETVQTSVRYRTFTRPLSPVPYTVPYPDCRRSTSSSTSGRHRRFSNLPFVYQAAPSYLIGVLMQYVCLIYTPADAPQTSQAEFDREVAEYGAFSQEARASGKLVGGEPLAPPSDARTVRVRGGKRTTTDGPFAETKEWLAGFYVFETDTLDEAIDWASKIPGARNGSIEVRPVMQFTNA